MRRKKAEQQEVPAGGGRVTPTDVQRIEFRLAFRGYNERDVDAYLDRITEDLAWYLEENQRLGSAGIAPVAAAAAGPDDARAEAEEILARARQEAAEIVRKAEVEAGASAAAGPVSGDPRAAVAPFLNAEREFLQSLGSLVQTHAEEVKQMVLALRARADSAREVSQPVSEPQAVAPEAASAAEIRERLGEPEPEAAPTPDHVIVDIATEPAYSSEGAPAGEGRERSLRELFWGDE